MRIKASEEDREIVVVLSKEDVGRLKLAKLNVADFGRLSKKKLERLLAVSNQYMCPKCGKQAWITESPYIRRMIIAGKDKRTYSDYCQGKCD